MYEKTTKVLALAILFTIGLQVQHDIWEVSLSLAIMFSLYQISSWLFLESSELKKIILIPLILIIVGIGLCQLGLLVREVQVSGKNTQQVAVEWNTRRGFALISTGYIRTYHQSISFPSKWVKGFKKIHKSKTTEEAWKDVQNSNFRYVSIGLGIIVCSLANLIKRISNIKFRLENQRALKPIENKKKGRISSRELKVLPT